MRVWQINQHEWVAGPTLLAAMRAAGRELGLSANEMRIDRECFGEITDLDSVHCYEPESDRDLTLSEAVAEMSGPGVVMSTDW